MTTTHKGGVLVAVANPEGVAPLIAIALAASDPNGGVPPLVLALVRQTDGGAGSEPQGAQANAPPSSAALSAAIEYARARGVTIDAQAVRSDDPALDIITIGHSARVAWILLGYHRAASGGDTLGGVVREVLFKAKGLPFSVGVFIQVSDRPFERVFAAIDAGPDGRAALELVTRLVQRAEYSLHVIRITGAGEPAEPELSALLAEAARVAGRRLHTEAMASPTADSISARTAPGLVVIGAALADQLGLARRGFADGRPMILV